MTAASIEISDSQNVLPVDEHLLRDVVERTLAAENVARAEIGLAVVDDAAIHELNRRHLDHDYPTDVLSFVLECVDREVPTDGSDSSIEFLEGEIVVSAETALRRAAEFGWRPCDELVLYVVHGLLHLVGYDDRTPSELMRMRSRERAILCMWNLTPRYDESVGEQGASQENDGKPGGHS